MAGLAPHDASVLGGALDGEPSDLDHLAEVGAGGAMALAGGGVIFDRRVWTFPESRGKRAADIVVSATVLLLMPLLFAVIALAIVLESPGPVFYRAERVGRGGRRMLMLKFRKMRQDVTSGIKLTTGGDERLTRVGAFLTRSKLDELPQFVNVLRGSMSLIGPRPEDPDFVAERRADYAEILTVRPGITGYSQIAFADESRILAVADPVGHYLRRIFPAKCALDRMYVQNLSLRTDMRILFWTVMAVLFRRGVAVHRGTGSMNLRRRALRSGGGQTRSHEERPEPELHVVHIAAAPTARIAGVVEPGKRLRRTASGSPV
jgi:lipopolysaccharide/colanic/teichoic acid biosynthesis glycosyltransferase